jgi:4,5-dihydroxyphthalate decarboxylase
MGNIHLTVACGDYEIVRPIKEGVVKIDGVDLTVLTDIDSSTRHWRFLRNQEFDFAEVSSSSYLLARDNGMEIEGIPIFLHRRFRHEFVFINTKKGIKEPKDLIGKRIGVKSFQVSAILWMRGILEHEYGVPHKSIHWFSEIDEDVEFTPAPDLKWSRLKHDQTLEDMLVAGELDAVIHSDLIDPYLNGDPNVARLFDDYKSEEERYFKKTGIFPIMHVMAIKRELVKQNPWLPVNIYKAFEKAKEIGMKRMFNPRIVPLVWYRHAWDEQQKLFGPDPWEYGLSDKNRNTLDTLVGYSYEQGMLKRRWPLDELFLNVSQGRKRGGFRV